MGKVIGIDLGTTNSVAACIEGKTPEIVLTPEGDRLLPSLVAFGKTGERLVGNPAKSQLITNVNTIYSVKRLMGKRFSEVSPYLDQFNYDLVEGENDTIKIEIGDVLFSPEQVSAMILEKLKEAAEEWFNSPVEGAIITVPAYFNDSQRQATKDAGEIAGLEVLRIINEPTAASLAFSIDLSKKANVVVYDFGGGTIDISILEVQNEVIKVLSTAGDINLGGNDLDNVITLKLLEEIKKEYDVDLSENKMALQRIRDAAENAKKELSSVDECEINLPFIADSPRGQIHFLRYFTRKELEKLIKKKVDRTLEICSKALNHADLTIDQIDEVLLVGGSTRIPYVQDRIKEFFNKEPNKKVNPDEIVAMGAAMQGSIATGESKDILLLDVIPLALGVKTLGGGFSRIIEANTTIPTNRSLVFSTAEDNQTEVEINIFQGEREVAEQNKLLGKFTLTGIRPAPKGLARVEVIFSIDINGILTVTAIDLSTKNKKRVVVTNSGLLSKEEIREIKSKAEKFKESDLQKKQVIQIKNDIVNFIYMIKQYLHSSEVGADLAYDARQWVEIAQEALDQDDADDLREVREQLDSLNLKLSTTVSEPVSAQGGYTPLAHQDSAPLPTVPKTPAPPPPPPPPGSEPEPEPVAEPVAEPEPVRAEPTPIPMGTADEPIVAGGAVQKEEKKPKKKKGSEKEIMALKKSILNSVYNIEQYMENLKLDDLLEAECKFMLARTHSELETEDTDILQRMKKDLGELIHKLDRFVSANLGVDGKPKTRADVEKENNNGKKDDTKPFKIFQG